MIERRLRIHNLEAASKQQEPDFTTSDIAQTKHRADACAVFPGQHPSFKVSRVNQ
jgi:hypothetical protein